MYMEKINEPKYIERILEGEINLFSYFSVRYSKSIFALILRIVVVREDAEELTQDVFVKAFEKLHTFKGDCSFSTWLFRIAYNKAISATRKTKTIYYVIDENQLENIQDDVVDRIFENDDNENQLQKLELAIEKLNVEDKTLISLYYLDEKSIADVAMVLGISADNVKIKLYRVRKKLFVLMNNPEL